MLKRFSLGAAILCASFAAATATASAQSGHFVQAQTCRDVGTQVSCSGKVAGLGGTTFEVSVSATGVAQVQCRNPGGNVAPGQDTEVTSSGSSGPLPTPRNGNYRYSLTSAAPSVPNYPTCPNPQWQAEVVDVAFTDATITLREDGAVVDQVVVPVG